MWIAIAGTTLGVLGAAAAAVLAYRARMLRMMDFTGAARKGDVEALRALLDRGVKPEARDLFGQTALTLAAFYHHEEAVRLLLKAGAGVLVESEVGGVPICAALVFAQRRPQAARRVVRMLLEAGSDVLQRGADGSSAVDRARRLGVAARAEYWIERRAYAEALAAATWDDCPQEWETVRSLGPDGFADFQAHVASLNRELLAFPPERLAEELRALIWDILERAAGRK